MTVLVSVVCEEDVGDGEGEAAHSCGGGGGMHAGFKLCNDSGLRGDQLDGVT